MEEGTMKVKFFEFLKVSDGEGKINEWLEDNPPIKIRFVTHSRDIRHLSIISVWYENKPPSQRLDQDRAPKI